ncbi:PDR/VanB family oxidoreductase [Mycobacterium sp. ACS4331]|uniref:PDR/VanB family oxidoreductase n=1 Tax=Mycobacterium sp. ACS4331 TaxID=1834121 RepID=UPI0008001E30|nr:PDR/VanB family oxidoreductase [Mycobacterium sp. ACS4331]OBF29694.1 ferredoxin [Mycobacterium sp. ACS4331]
MSSAVNAELELTVSVREDVADRAVALTLRRPDGRPLPCWEPGAHIDLVLGDGLVRQYSLCGNPGEQDSWRIAVQLEPDGRGGSREVHERLLPGATVRVRVPRNNFRLESAERYTFIAGGIGITPLLPMIAAVNAAGADWHLTYGGRQRSSMAFADELVAEYGDRVTVRPQDEVGVIDLDALLGAQRTIAADERLYCCGPAPLLAAVEQRISGDSRDRLRIERFEPAEDTVRETDQAFEIELASTGQVLTVEATESILDALARDGYKVESSCQEGLCGTCETGVLAGEVDHRDTLLTPAEREANELMMICVSRAACPRLVLDL